MNILFVTPDYPKRGQPTTGFPNYLFRVSLALVQMGHKPIILSAGTWDNHRIDEGIEIWTVGINSYPNPRFQALKYALHALKVGYHLNKKIKEVAEKVQLDVIQFTSLYGLALLYRGETPAVLRLSSYAKTAYASYQTYSPIDVKIISLFEKASSYKCKVIFSPCKNNAEAFGKDCKRKVKVIETPFVNDVQKYDNAFVDIHLNGKKYVLFFGTLYIEKGILVIAEILEQFLNLNQDYYFVFIGDACNINGENAANILQRSAGKCSNRIIISKALPHKLLYPIIREADFVVLPSLMENLSNACIEAMYHEKVVIGTNGASFEQLITHGQNGLLCKIGDSQDLFEKMQSVVTMSVSQKRKIGKLAKHRIDKLKPDRVVKKLIQLYEYVINKNNCNGKENIK